MGLLDRLRKNSVDKLNLWELREEQMRLRNSIERIRENINRLEKEKKAKFQEGIGADMIKKEMLAIDIEQIEREKSLELSNFKRYHKLYTFVSNLITIKKYEKELKKTKIWDELTKVTPEQLEAVLIRLNLSNKEFEEVLDDLNRIPEIIREVGTETEIDESKKKIFEAWSSVEAGTMSPEEAEKMLSTESSEKES